MRDLLPNGMLGVAIAGLLASFMAGMAANISAFNTVFSYDLWQTYVGRTSPTTTTRAVGRIATVAATIIAIGTALFASQLLEHHELPADAVRVLQRPAVRDVHPRHVLEADDRRPPAGSGLVSGTLAAVLVGVLSKDALGPMSIGAIGLTGQGASFVGRRCGVRRGHRGQRRWSHWSPSPSRSPSCGVWSTR